MMTKNGDESIPNDFVDYFFQKEGDTFISQLLKLRDDFNGKCVQALTSVNPSTRSDYDDFTCRFLRPDKIAPTIYRAENNFDFDGTLTSIFDNLNLNVTDTLEMISKYYGFIANLQNHWKGLELDSATVIGTSVQLMATLESMVYPLFLKLTNYIGSLAANPDNAADTETPEMLMKHLHKLSEALTMEIATIGASGVVSLSQCPYSSKESMLCDSVKLGNQGRNAKNCISWAMKAVAPALQLYFLCAKSSESATKSGMCPCSPQQQGKVKSVTSSKKSRQSDEDDIMRTPRKQKTPKKTQDAQIQAKEDRFVTSATKNIQVEAEEDDDDDGESFASLQKLGPASGLHPLANETEDFQTETRNNADEQGNDFVSYFFKKNGIKYVAILAQTKKKYEQRCKSLLSSATHEEKSDAKSFIDTVHDVRKMSPETGEDELDAFNFPEVIADGLADFDVSVEDKLSLLRKYQEYARGMIRHWKYRIENNKVLTPDTVVDVGVQIMATTMALTYPIFIRIGEFLRKLSRAPDSAKHSPEDLADALHALVEASAQQMAAIATSCLTVISIMPNVKSDLLVEKRANIEAQLMLAKNSIAWAIKCISPLLLLFYIKVNTSIQETAEMRGPRNVTPKKQRVASFEEEHIIPIGGGDEPEPADEIEDSKVLTPYQTELHQNYASKYFQKPTDPQNFVYYFYSKEGQLYSTILSNMRKKYEEYVHNAMDNIKPSIKDRVPDFINKYHDARRPTVPNDDVEVEDIKFRDSVNQIFYGLDINIKGNINTLIKYFEFTRNLVAHWHYRITKRLELDQDAVAEMSIEMMGTTVALTYPIFIKIAEYIVDIMKNNQVTVGHLTPNSLVERFKQFVYLLTTEMAAIGMSGTTIMAQLPYATRESVSSRTIRLANETKIADGAIAWAMKAVFPVFMLYFLQYQTA